MNKNCIVAKFEIRYEGFSLSLDLTLPAKGVTVLFGHSGSGKTTCLRAMAGLEKLSEGYFSAAGEVWQDSGNGLFIPTYKRNIGYVFQEAGLFPHLTVQQNLEYGLKRIASSKRRVEKDSVCSLLGIEHLLDRSTARLSGGERQRVSIARALLTSPDLLLMDEPLSALDNGRKAEILPYLERLHKELSIPVIYVTHAMEELARLADHIVLFDQGRIVASDSALNIMSDPQHQALFGTGLGSIVETKIVEHCADHMTRLDIGEQTNLWILGHYGTIGEQYRCRILASDVGICLSMPEDSSISNEIPVTIKQIEPTAKPGEVALLLETRHGTRLLSLITQHSLKKLSLTTGMDVWAQVKSVAVC